MRFAAAVVVVLLLALHEAGARSSSAYSSERGENVAASHLPPGPPPQVHMRSYQLADERSADGLAVVVERKAPQFPAVRREAGRQGLPGVRLLRLAPAADRRHESRGQTYSETPVDSHTVEWTDKTDGRVVGHGRRRVSEDGKTLTLTALFKNDKNEELEYRFVFDRQ